MRFIREAQGLERHESCRSHLKKWIDMSRSRDAENKCLEEKHSEVRHALFLAVIRRTSSVSSLAPSMKKAQSPLAVKWSSYIEAIGLKDTSSKQRRVRFVENDVEYDELHGCTEQEEPMDHTLAEELVEKEVFSTQFVPRGSRFADQPEDTILEQGFLTMPVNAPFFQNRRYYCLLRGHNLQMFTSAAHAAKNSGLKEQLTILRVQDCETLPTQKQFALFGASLPVQISLMFYVIKTNGERVIFTADTKSSKRNWVHSLTRVTYVGEGKCYTSTPLVRSWCSSTPTPSICTLPPVPEVEPEEEMQDDVSAFKFLESDRRNTCTTDHNACRHLEPNAQSHKKIFGRLKVCTRGFFFVPQDLQRPILRFPFRSFIAEPVAECFVQWPIINFERISDYTIEKVPVVYLTFQTQQVIELQARGIDHPYIYKDTSITKEMEVIDTGNKQKSSLRGETPAKYIFTLQHVTLDAFLASIHVIYDVSKLPRRLRTKAEEEALLAPVLAPRLTDKFDLSLLIDFRERILMKRGCVANRIEPLLKFPGCLMLTTRRLYFQPAPLNNVLDPVLNWDYTDVDQVYKRRYLLQQIGLEIYLSNGDSFFFSFRSQTERDDFYALLMGQPELQRCRRKDLQFMMQKWQQRELSNFDYLKFLNNASGRTCNDLTQYPVFPWILCDYTSPDLHLDNPKVYRDLTKPIGALNEERLEYFKGRYEAMPRGDEAEGTPPPFLYGTHYSTPGYVLYFLVRKAPQCMLCLQGGKFDAPDRLFHSIKVTWDGCMSNYTDVKELIPEFFDCTVPASEWLQNNKHLDLGTMQNFERVDDVVLPPWAHGDAKVFVQKNRAALESDYVSDSLHHWIDLIFGYKQRGEEAVEANNLFYYLSYEGSVDLQAIDDPMQRSSLEAQIQEFGQTPKLLFSTPHPHRNEGDGKVKVATPDLLVSPRDVAPRIRRVSFPLPASRLRHQKVAALSSFKEYADSEGKDCNHRPHPYGCSLICVQIPWKLLRNTLFGQLWGSVRSGKPPKKWRWRSRLKTKYSLSTSWSWKQISASQLHKGEVTSTILSKDASFLLTTSKDSSLKLSSTEDVTQSRDVSGEFALSCCDLSPDESVVFVGSWDNCVYMHSATTGLVLDKVFAHSDGISAIRVFQNRFFTSSWDSTVKLWQYTSRRIISTPLRTFLDCEESVLCLDVSRDGLFGAAGTRNGLVYLFNLSVAMLHNRVQVGSESRNGIASISFAEDNQSYVCVTVQSELFQFNLYGEKLWSMDIRTAGQVRCFESDGNYGVGSTTAGKILFWKFHEVAGTELVYEIPQAHDASISSLEVSCCGSILVSGAVDGSVHVWKLYKKPSLKIDSSDMFHSSSRRRSRILQYGSIQTLTSTSTAPISKQQQNTRHHPSDIPNFTTQFAEADYFLE
ncbi:unnamed protein product [Peronospora farinosa]|uniref:PH domain-containing protein n=1 Tax=Peronospora farinosa TaxID=134698 RepID=A0AAV0UQJ8_9STRA|nr:unnamed protein product [Peronospora farinosa]